MTKNESKYHRYITIQNENELINTAKHYGDIIIDDDDDLMITPQYLSEKLLHLAEQVQLQSLSIKDQNLKIHYLRQQLILCREKIIENDIKFQNMKKEEIYFNYSNFFPKDINNNNNNIKNSDSNYNNDRILTCSKSSLNRFSNSDSNVNKTCDDYHLEHELSSSTSNNNYNNFITATNHSTNYTVPSTNNFNHNWRSTIDLSFTTLNRDESFRKQLDNNENNTTKSDSIFSSNNKYLSYDNNNDNNSSIQMFMSTNLNVNKAKNRIETSNSSGIDYASTNYSNFLFLNENKKDTESIRNEIKAEISSQMNNAKNIINLELGNTFLV
jgi:hypothetical protein